MGDARWEKAVFPAYSWVLAKRLLSGWLVGWLVGGKSCLSRVACLSACGRGLLGPSVCAVRSTERRDSAECVIQRRFAIRVDSLPSCKLGSTRRRPRVTVVDNCTLSVRPSVRLSVRM